MTPDRQRGRLPPGLTDLLASGPLLACPLISTPIRTPGTFHPEYPPIEDDSALPRARFA